MKRKVNLVGSSTLTVSLPSKWIKDNKITKGDELDVYMDKGEICFSRGEKKEEKKEITVDITNYYYPTIGRHFFMLYKANYNHIIFTYAKPIFFLISSDFVILVISPTSFSVVSYKFIPD